MRPNTETDFWLRVWKCGHHWRWTGRSRKFSYQGKLWYPERLAWLFTHGSIPAGRNLEQLCDDERCIHPEHHVWKSSQHPAKVARFWGRVNKNGPIVRAELGPCWEWTGGLMADGYGSLTWCLESQLAHRVAWLLTHGEYPAQCLCHKCDNRKCVRDDHLFEGTVIDNNADKMAKGRFDSKLSAADVVSIRSLYLNGTRISVLARRFGVDWTAIHKIVTGKRWERETLGISIHKKSTPLRGSEVRHLAKLHEVDIPTIRSLYRSGETQCAIAARFGVTQAVISKVVLRQTWKHVSD